MAVNHGVEILVDDGETDNFKTNVLRRIIRALSGYTLVPTTLATSYSAGSSSTNEMTLSVGDEQDAFTADFAVRLIFDTAVVGTDIVPEIERVLIQAFEKDTISITHTAAYTAGDRTYNMVLTVT